MALGCTHGHLADQDLLTQVLAFEERWKPHLRIHLGDAIDLACLRGGAAGTADDAIDPELDL
jgi:predicted phosphodiesterase